MNTNRILIRMLLTMALAIGASHAGPERFPWLTDLDEARALASEKNMPMLIVFRCEP